MTEQVITKVGESLFKGSKKISGRSIYNDIETFTQNYKSSCSHKCQKCSSHLEENTSKSNFKILIVDDMESIINVITKKSKDLGFTSIDHATSAQEAIIKLKNNKYDLVLCDYRMPGGNGNLVFGFIQTMELCTEFIMISGYGESEMFHLKKLGILLLNKNSKYGSPTFLKSVEIVIKGLYIKTLQNVLIA